MRQYSLHVCPSRISFKKFPRVFPVYLVHPVAINLTLSKLPLPLRKKFHSLSEMSPRCRIISPHNMNEKTSLSFSNRPLKYIDITIVRLNLYVSGGEKVLRK